MNLDPYFYPSQIAWIKDDSPLKLCVKSRRTGFSFANSFRLVRLVSAADAPHDAFIVSRDKPTAELSLQDCLHWAELLHLGATPLGEVLFDAASSCSAFALRFANGRRIFCLSSNPNALAGKGGHVTLDEFALHPDQRLLFRLAKPLTTWGGEFSIISTPRDTNSLFHHLVLDAKAANPMHWSLHEIPIQKAVAEGLVERINAKKGSNESRDDFLKRLRAECIDHEQWDQEYCCTFSDESSAFFSHDLLDSCTDPSLRLLSLNDFLASLDPTASRSTLHAPTLSRPSPPTFFLGLDVARFHNLCVLDLGEKIDGITYDRLRLELQDQPFSQIEAQLYPLLALPQLKRASIDATGMGGQLAERARERFGWKVDPVSLSAPLKEQLAFALRRDFEDRRLRIPNDDLLRADLRALKKELSPAGRILLDGQSDNSHCDRTWAKALRQRAAHYRPSAGALVI